MPTDLEKCEQQAKHLPLRERALLIKRLIEGLDEHDEHDLEQLWLKEASRRFKEYKAGDIRARPAANVFHDARTRLREMR